MVRAGPGSCYSGLTPVPGLNPCCTRMLTAGELTARPGGADTHRILFGSARLTCDGEELRQVATTPDAGRDPAHRPLPMPVSSRGVVFFLSRLFPASCPFLS